MKRSKLLTVSILFNLIFLIGILLLLHRFGGIRTVYYKVKNRGLSEQYQHRQDLFKQLDLQKGDIIFLGNSITEQCEWAELFGMPNIKNRGISGDGVEGLLARMDRIIASEPRAIYLMIGINDLFFHDVDWLLPHYRKILETFKTQLPNTIVRVQSVLPVNGAVKFVGVSNEAVVALNQKIKIIAEETGYEYIDLHQHFKNEKGQLQAELTSDGLHLNGKAYRLWKEILETDLAKLN